MGTAKIRQRRRRRAEKRAWKRESKLRVVAETNRRADEAMMMFRVDPEFKPERVVIPGDAEATRKANEAMKAGTTFEVEVATITPAKGKKSVLSRLFGKKE